MTIDSSESVNTARGSSDGDPRFVPLQSVFNFRDLGGLTGLDGRTTRPGLVYRSDQFGHATKQDLAHLIDKIGLRTVVDLRRPVEIEASAAFPADSGVTIHNHELKHIRWEAFEFNPSVETTSTPFLVQRYTAMIETGAEAIRSTLDLMCEATPLVFHCMAGKDRTGITAAVALGLLGVSKEDIAADYALTNQGMSRYKAWLAAQGTPLSQWGLEPTVEAMAGLLDNIDTHFGGVESYAAAIGFNQVERLRAHLLH